MTKEMYFEDLHLGDVAVEFVSEPITRTAMVRYAGASGDFNPLHHDETFVALFGMPRVIAQGMMVMGITSRAITDVIPQKYLRSFQVRFTGVTEPVDLNNFEETKNRATLKVKATVNEKSVINGENIVVCEVETTDMNGTVKLSGGIRLALPNKG